MADFWQTLERPWQACLEQAWIAYCAGSLPIGAVITDAAGTVLSRGRNRRHDPREDNLSVSGSRLAHAELNALIALPEDDSERHGWILYTTTEPCPLCVGAFYMSGLRQLHYASRDPWAGSVNLLGRTPYMSRKPIRVFGPPQEDLEAILVAMAVSAILKERILNAGVVLDKKRQAMPLSTRFGDRLFEDEILERLCAADRSLPEVYNYLARHWQEFKQSA